MLILRFCIKIALSMQPPYTKYVIPHPLIWLSSLSQLVQVLRPINHNGIIPHPSTDNISTLHCFYRTTTLEHVQPILEVSNFNII